MVWVTFISANGKDRDQVFGQPGRTLLEVAQENGQPLEGTCEGQMACSTCHVIVDPADFNKLPAASDAEEDMLDLAAAATRNSRLACQIMLDTSYDTLTVRIPPESRNMQGV